MIRIFNSTSTDCLITVTIINFLILHTIILIIFPTHQSSLVFFLSKTIYYLNFSGNLTAGNYTDKPKLKNLKQCVLGCCSVETCNVVFMYDSKCYHIECVSNELCLPHYRRHVEARMTMVLVNPVLEEGKCLFDNCSMLFFQKFLIVETKFVFR